MKAFFQFIVQSILAFLAMVVTWLISFLAMEQTFFLSSLFALFGGGVVFIAVKEISHTRFVRRNGLTRREYKYIGKNLKEAKDKISRLQRALMSVRRIDQAKQNLEIIRTVKKIYMNTKKEPKRFYKAEGFYYDHLDSLVELTEKYAFLSSQPTKSKEIQDSLRDTRITLIGLKESVKKDLYIMLDDDVDTLHFEIDVAKNSINRMKKNDRRMFK
nr:5-bromo-4-chloroindolyl phosphate hydrolysis family protein [Oceanobacillus salinisoli]